MSNEEERAALAAAHEAAGWNSPPTVPVWELSPSLNSTYDVMYFKTLDDAVEYIQAEIADHIDCRCTTEDLIKYGFTLQLRNKMISQEQYDALFSGEAEWIEVSD